MAIAALKASKKAAKKAAKPDEDGGASFDNPGGAAGRGISTFQRRTSLKKFASAAEEATMKAEEKVCITEAVFWGECPR